MVKTTASHRTYQRWSVYGSVEGVGKMRKNKIIRKIIKIFCYFGFHKFKKLPKNYNVFADARCWWSIDFDKYNPDRLYKCIYCGEIEEKE